MLSRTATVVATMAFVASGLAGRAAAQAPAFPACPEAFPVSELRPGMVGTGLKVETGTEPEPFTATVIGVIDDGIAPDVDMVVVDVDSPAVERAGGMWQGMSGSPVYAADGRLMGAVSYSLGVLSPVAGITPAADMRSLLDRPAAAPSPTAATDAANPSAEAAASASDTDPVVAEVALPEPLQDEVVSSGEATRAEAAAGLRRLPLPLGVSGINPLHMDGVRTRLEQRLPGALVHPAGAAPVGTPGSRSEIVPGGNFAAAISYGDVTISAVGTTTMVCPGATGDVALAFGHPLGQLGVTSYSAHTASAVYVQTDAQIGPFKVANPGGAVGVVDQDRLAGIRGMLGPAPASIPVSSTVLSVDDGAFRTGTSRVNAQQFLPLVGPEHLMANLDRAVDRIGGGISAARWVVTGQRASGAPFTLDAANWYADQADITAASGRELAEQLALIDANPFEPVRITGVELLGMISGTFRQYSLDEVLVRQADGSYEPAPTGDAPLLVVAGGQLGLRLVLTPYQGRGQVQNVDLTLDIPAEAAGAVGALQVTGGRGSVPPGPPDLPRSLDDLVAQLQEQAPNNSVTVTLSAAPAPPEPPAPPIPMPPTALASARHVVDQVVTGELVIPALVLPPGP